MRDTQLNDEPITIVFYDNKKSQKIKNNNKK